MKKCLIVGLFSTVSLLSGCSSNAEFDRDISSLNQKVNDLSGNIEQMKIQQNQIETHIKVIMSISKQAQSNAQKANSRLDKLASDFKK